MTSISTPTQLATFSQSHASSSKSKSHSHSHAQHITLSPVVGDHKCAIAAVRGDGVWTYDLSTLRPTTSFTVPPSTTFTSNAISYWTTRKPSETGNAETEEMEVDEQEDEEGAEEVKLVQEERGKEVEVKERITLVGVGKEIWVWKGEEGDKQVIEVNDPVKSLHHLSSPSYPILAVSSSSQLYLLDPSLKPYSVTLQGLAKPILTARVLSSSVNVTRVAIVDSEGNVVVSRIDLDQDIQSVRAERVAGGKVGGGRLVSADVSGDGVISVLDESNNVYTSDIPSLATASATPLRLVHPSTTPTLLSLPTSGKPLILLPTSHPTPSLLLTVPLSTLPAVLTSTSISSFSSSGSISHLSIVSSRNGVITVGVVLNHLNSDGESGRSVIYTCEVIVPSKGVGMAMLLGTKDRTSTYISGVPSLTGQQQQNGAERKGEKEKKQDEIVDKISATLKKNDSSAVERHWTAWTSANSEHLSEQLAKHLLVIIFSAALNDEGKLKGSYAAGVVRDLIQRGLVSDSMWHNGVVADGLLPCGDWATISTALETMRTIPSSSLVGLLTATLHPSTSKLTTPAPKMVTILRLILASPPPAPSFRLDMRKGLSVEDATAVLSQLVQWAEEHVLHRSEGLNGWDVEGVSGTAVNGKAHVQVPNQLDSELPSLESTINYCSIILDSHLPSFISYEPSHELLERLQASLEPLLSLQMEYRQLRGPVEAVLTLARREARKQEEREIQQRTKGRHGADKKRDGKNGAGAGAGSKETKKLPEEVVGKWKVEDLVF